MQDTLNKMVASVRHGVIAPEHGSRAIHECAAILGLQLAEDFPEDTLIVTGMRKTVKRNNVIDAFDEFGEIEGAAVSANNRGFGTLCFGASIFEFCGASGSSDSYLPLLLLLLCVHQVWFASNPQNRWNVPWSASGQRKLWYKMWQSCVRC